MVEKLSELKKICFKNGKKDRYIRSFTILLTKLLLKFDPIWITSLWIILGITGAILFVKGTYIWSLIAAIIIFISYTLDYVDGQIARYKKFKREKMVLTLEKGEILDWIGSWGVALLTFMTITFGLLFHPGNSFIQHPKLILLIGFFVISSYSLKELLPLKTILIYKNNIPSNNKGKKMYSLWRKITFIDYPNEILLITAIIGHLELYLIYYSVIYTILWNIKEVKELFLTK